MSFISASNPELQFGSFDYFCSQLGLPVCALVGAPPREPTCYARNIDIASLLVFQPATLLVILVALLMTGVMISHIKFKYTAVGRKEIVLFFYLYAATLVCDFFTISGIVPFGSSVHPYVVALQVALLVCTCWCLFMNGFVPFQLIEDGTPVSMWMLRISTAAVFAITFFISIATFQNVAGMSSSTPSALWTLYIAFPPILVIVYAGLQYFLVFTTLPDKWLASMQKLTVVDMTFAVIFYILSNTTAFLLSTNICTVASHYLDGMFFSTVCTLLAVMMVYKFWDEITKEDLEFAVGCKSHSWEIKDPLLSDAAMGAMSNDVRRY